MRKSGNRFDRSVAVRTLKFSTNNSIDACYVDEKIFLLADGDIVLGGVDTRSRMGPSRSRQRKS
jgi:hypothetical protein